MHASAVIAGAGSSLRFLTDQTSSAPTDRKQFQTIGSQQLILWTLQPFLASTVVESVVLVVPQDSVDWMTSSLSNRKFKKEIRVVAGGMERQNSVRNGVEMLLDISDIVVIHDAVRPFLKMEWIEKTAALCSDYDGAIVAVRAKDTLKQVSAGVVTATLDRSVVWQAQTPQTFNMDSLVSAYDHAEKNGILGTDEAQLVELNGGTVAIVEGSHRNIKITTQEDWELAEAIWQRCELE